MLQQDYSHSIIENKFFGVFKNEDMPHITDVIKQNIELGFYAGELINKFTPEQWDEINNY